MPVNATPATTQVVTLDDVRGFLRDVGGQIPGTSSYNALFDLPEFSDADVNRALKYVVSKFNVMTPPSSDAQETIPAWILLVGTAAFLCQSETFRQQRNQVTYQAGNIAPIGLDDKHALYTATARACWEEFDQLAKAWKVSRNMESCWGSLGSGYRSVSRFHHSS